MHEFESKFFVALNLRRVTAFIQSQVISKECLRKNIFLTSLLKVILHGIAQFIVKRFKKILRSIVSR